MATRTRTPREDVAVAEPEVVETPRELGAIELFLEHQRKALAEAGKAVMSFVPECVQTHGEAAVTEAVVGYRDLVNSTLDEIVEFVQKAKLETDETVKEL